MARSEPNGNHEASASALQPRYRRIFTVGALLDETIQLFRQHWITLALFGLVALVPSWLLILYVYVGGVSGAFTTAAARATSFETFPLIGILVLGGLGLLSGLFSVLWTAAATSAADAFMRGQQPTMTGVYLHALKRFPTMVGAFLLYLLAIVGLSIAASLLFVVTGFGVLGTLAASIGLLVWWLNPPARRPWLKWMIILTTPFGLVAYYTVRWALLLPAIVLEWRGPLAALQRSRSLTEHQWFRTFAVLALAGIIVAILVSVPILLVDAIFALAIPAARGSANLLQVANSTASSVCQVLFSSIGTIAYVLLYVDLRNRREGTDLGERIGSLETSPA